jgi:subtilisin family serine protease
MMKYKSRLALTTGLFAIALTGCGGGGSSPPPPSPPPVTVVPPSPTPPPPPPPPSSAFDDAEYRRSAWLVAANALPAYERGASGRSVRIAIIDSGVNAADAEFAGRIDPLGPGTSDDDGHGTAVAMVAAGGRNGAGTMGVAFEATILAYDTLRCTTDCFHSIDDIAAAVDAAVLHGARVINLSHVGPRSRSPLFEALQRATAAGVVVVIAAGNEGGTSPNGFALQNAEQVRSSLIIIAGAHDSTRLISAGTDRAGAGAEWYVAAFAGATSFSTPVVSGAIALIAAAFPNLTGAEIVALLMSSADDAGAPGRDEIYGNGILNIGRAFAQAQAMVAAQEVQ